MYWALLDDSFNVESEASKLMPIDEENLSTWLINNYIGQCAQLCPDNVTRLFSDVSTSVELQNAVSEIVRWRRNTSLVVTFRAIHFAETLIPILLPRCSSVLIRSRSCAYWMNELAEIDKRFTVYTSAVAMLHVACGISRNGFVDELVDILSTKLGHNFSECRSVLSLCKAEPNTSELVDYLQTSAVELLTSYRQIVAAVFAAVTTIVTTDFEALYAYKCGDYQRCLQLSTQNVHKLMFAKLIRDVILYLVFFQLLDDDLVSLIALRLIVDSECGMNPYESVVITQLNLSLYLMTQCQLKLYHSVTSLAQTLEYIKIAQKLHSRDRAMDPLTLKLIERKAIAKFEEVIDFVYDLGTI